MYFYIILFGTKLTLYIFLWDTTSGKQRLRTLHGPTFSYLISMNNILSREKYQVEKRTKMGKEAGLDKEQDGSRSRLVEVAGWVKQQDGKRSRKEKQ